MKYVTIPVANHITLINITVKTSITQFDIIIIANNVMWKFFKLIINYSKM